MCSLVVDKPTCSSCAGVNWVMYVKWQLSTWNKDSPVRTHVRWDLNCIFLLLILIHLRYTPTSLWVQSSTGSLLRVSISSSFRNKLFTKIFKKIQSHPPSEKSWSPRNSKLFNLVLLEEQDDHQNIAKGTKGSRFGYFCFEIHLILNVLKLLSSGYQQTANMHHKHQHLTI